MTSFLVAVFLAVGITAILAIGVFFLFPPPPPDADSREDDDRHW